MLITLAFWVSNFGAVIIGILHLIGLPVLVPEAPGDGETPPYTSPLAFLGRHTLFIYLVHQPILIAALRALGIVSLGF